MTERTVLITGAAGGIGSALCEEFHREGWHVIASDKQQTCDAPYHSYVQLDLARMCTDDQYAHERMNALRDQIPDGQLHGLINNAAVQITAPFEDLGNDAWNQTINTNLLAPAFLTRQLLAELESGKGVVLNIASIHARLTKPGFSAYATSKAGLVGLTRALAVELGGRVRVNAICPAAIDTPMLMEGLENADDLTALRQYHPSGCIGSSQELAKTALWLVEPYSPFLTGAILGIDGALASRLADPA